MHKHNPQHPTGGQNQHPPGCPGVHDSAVSVSENDNAVGLPFSFPIIFFPSMYACVYVYILVVSMSEHVQRFYYYYY